MSILTSVHDLIPSFPDEFKQKKVWCIWHSEERNGKQTKIPDRPIAWRPGQCRTAPAKSNDPTTWVDFETACAAVASGAGYSLGVFADGTCSFIDLDKCASDGVIDPWAQSVLLRCGSYAEWSPSGTGIHIFVGGSVSKAAKINGCEIYSTARFFTVTGQQIEGTPNTVRAMSPAELEELHDDIANDELRPSVKSAPTMTRVDGKSERLSREQRSAKIARLLDGDTSDYGHDRSSAVAATLHLLMWKHAGDRDLVREEFESSRLCGDWGDKWDRLREREMEHAYAHWQERIDQLQEDDRANKIEDPRDRHLAPDGFYMTQMGNAQRMVASCGQDLRWIQGATQASVGTFYVWSGARWERDKQGKVTALAKESVRQLGRMVGEVAARSREEAESLMSWWKKSETHDMVEDMKRLIRSDVSTVASAFDADKMMVGLQNGTLDLRTGVFREARHDDLITRLMNAKFDPTATCPTWERFLLETTQGDRDLVRYLQQCVGMCLSGENLEHLAFFIVGRGGTGKTTFQEALLHVWGDYACGFDPNALSAGKPSTAQARPDLAKLVGIRMVFANESRAGWRIDEGLFKAMTGGDTLTVRNLYENEFDFIPHFKFWLRTNFHPQFDGSDDAMQRRIRLVPFNHRVSAVDKDEHLPEKLKAEADGVFQWALSGWQDYQANGLVESAVVKQSSAEYVSGLDSLQTFIDERCEVRGNLIQQSAPLYRAYAEWMESRGQRSVNVNRFAATLRAKGFQSERTTQGIRWIGLRLQGNAPVRDDHGARSLLADVEPVM